MPLSEAERDVLTREANVSPISKPAPQWLGWTEALYRLWAQRGKIAMWIAIGFALSVFVGWRYPKFESTVQIMPPDSGGSGLAAMLPALTKSPAIAGLAGDLLGAKTTGAVFTKVLESRTVSDDLINRFDLRKHYGSRFWEDTRLKLADRTVIAEDKKSGVIAITVKDHDPELARGLANAYVEELNTVLAQVSTSAARRERIFIEQRLTEENESLQESERQFSQFASANMALDVPEQMKVTVEAAARLQGELIATKAQLEGLKQTYTPENIRVKSVQAHVNELERELAKINSGNTSNGTSQDASNPYPSVRKLPLLGVKWADLYRTNKIRETVVELLTQQYEMARIQEAKEIPTAKVLDPGSSPEHKRPNGRLIALGGTVLFAILACVGYLLKDWWDNWDHDDPRRMLIAHVYQSGPGRVTRIFRRRRGRPNEISQV